MIQRVVDVVGAFGPSVARLGLGMFVTELGKRPLSPLELYEYEGCPFCRKVREALTVLDLNAKVYPCPKSGDRFRPGAIKRSGKRSFPFLVDPNTGVELLESRDIVDYLFRTYGAGTRPLMMSTGPINSISTQLASVVRPTHGFRAKRSREPQELLELYSFEASPYCRLVREELCALEIPYLLRNVAKGSPQREAFVALSGKMMVPYLVDPNRDVAMHESEDIVRYLRENYAL